MKLVTKIFLNIYNNEKVITSYRLLKYSYNLRNNFYKEKVLLENRVPYDISKFKKGPSTNLFSDFNVSCKR